MDKQQDQFGTPNPTNTGGAGQTPATPGTTGNAGGTAASSRKSVPTPSAQRSSPTPEAQNHSTATAGAERQGEGQQTNAPESTLLDTALNSGKKWIEDSGVLNNVNQLPQSLKDLGTRALGKVSGLSTTQKVVGGAILASGIAWLATRKGKPDGSESSPYNYGRQRDAGSYGRRRYGYQTPDATISRPPAGTTGRSDSGSPYANSGSRFGSTDDSTHQSAANTGIHSGSGRSESSPSASTHTDHSAQTADHSSRSKDDGFRSME